MQEDPSTSPRRTSTRLVAAVAATTLLGLSALAVGVAAAASSSMKAKTEDDKIIAPGVQIAGIPVGGMTPDAARTRLREWARTQTAQPITLIAPRSGRRWNIPLAEAGGRFDIDPAVDKAFAVGKDQSWWERLIQGQREYDLRLEPEFRFNDNAIDRRLDAIAQTIHVPARSAKAKMDADTGVIEVAAPEQKGVRLDVAATKAALLKGGEDALKDGEKATLIIAEEKPAVTAADLGKISTLLGSFRTSYGSSSANRRHNVEKSAAYINGTILGPGETFSYNDTVGPRTSRRGWRMAHQYQDGRVVDGIGGGVCQASSTLYNAALLSGMNIVQRSNHSMPVKYVPLGRDATVSYGAIDLRFQNPTDGPVYIAARSGGGRLTFNLYGQEPSANRQYNVVSSGARGRPGGGLVVTTWRVVTNPDGSKVRESLGTDRYRALGQSAAAVSSRPRRRATVRRRAAPVVKPAAATDVAAASPAI